MTKQSRSKMKGKRKSKALKDKAVLPKRASLNTRMMNKENKKLSADTRLLQGRMEKHVGGGKEKNAAVRCQGTRKLRSKAATRGRCGVGPSK